MTAAVAGPGPDARPKRPYLAPVPDSEPPFDPIPEVPAVRPRAGEARPAAGGFRRSTPARRPVTGSTSVACEAVPSWSAEADVGVRRTATAQVPAPGRAAQVYATALVEVLAGRRPVGQLRVHTAPAVFAGLANRAAQGWGAPVQVASVRICQPADGVAEVSATVRGARRAHAMAFRLEGVDGRWRITALDIG